MGFNITGDVEYQYEWMNMMIHSEDKHGVRRQMFSERSLTKGQYIRILHMINLSNHGNIQN
jgi:hypothetical protein